MSATATVARLATVAEALALAEERLRDSLGTLPDPMCDWLLQRMIRNVAIDRGHVAMFAQTAKSYARQEGKAA